MTKDGVKSLEPVNLTTEFYNEQPQIIINKELYDIIWKYIPDADEEFYPVFSAERQIFQEAMIVVLNVIQIKMEFNNYKYIDMQKVFKYMLRHHFNIYWDMVMEIEDPVNINLF